MQQFSQKYTIVQLLEEMEIGTEFSSSSWPLHVTIADTFAVDWNSNDLRNNLRLLLGKLEPPTATTNHDEYFGTQKQTKVTVLNTSKELLQLHNKVVDLLQDSGALFNDPQFTGNGFRAHVTVQKHARVHAGDAILVNNLKIIDMFPDADPYKRRVIETIRVGAL